jgi:NADH:ubiquinone oxidoreductase subunit C
VSAHYLLEKVRDLCAEASVDAEESAGGEPIVDLPTADLRQVINSLWSEQQAVHLSAMTALLDGDELQVLYHLWSGAGLTLRIRCGGDSADEVPSIADLIPVADWYEREIHDLYGLRFDGHPALDPLLLPEGWDGQPPMRPTEENPCPS